MSEEEQKREHFRLVYPPSDRPKIVIGGEKYSILDLSEEGIKFGHPASVCLGIGNVVRGEITFANGEKETVVGKILRIIESNPSHTVIQLTQGLPLKRMMDEQRALIKKYKS